MLGQFDQVHRFGCPVLVLVDDDSILYLDPGRSLNLGGLPVPDRLDFSDRSDDQMSDFKGVRWERSSVLSAVAVFQRRRFGALGRRRRKKPQSGMIGRGGIRHNADGRVRTESFGDEARANSL